MKLKSLFWLFGFAFVFLVSIFINSNSVSALYTQDYGVRTLSWSNDECGNPYYSEGHLYNQYFSGCGVTTVVPISSSVTATGDTVVYSGKLNIVKEIDSNNSNRWRPYPRFGIRSVYFAGVPLILQQTPVINYWITDWSDNVNGVQMNYSTLTIQWSFIATGNISNTTGVIRISIYNDQTDESFDLNGYTNQLNYYYFEPTSDDIQIVFTDNGSSYYNQMINQNQTIISQNQDMLNYLKDNTEPNVDTSTLNSVSGWLPPGPVDSVLTLPFTLAQNVVNIFTGTSECRPIVLPFDFLGTGVSLTIPCLSTYLYQAGVSVIWNTVGIVISAFIYYYTFRWLYKFIEDVVTMRDNDTTMWGGL